MYCSAVTLGIVIVLTNSCSKTEEPVNKAPVCIITNPVSGNEIKKNMPVTISVNASDADGDIKEVAFFIDGIIIGTSANLPYQYDWDNKWENLGSYRIKATAYDNRDGSTSDEITIILTEAEDNPESPVASFTANLTSISPGSSVQFTDLSINKPVNWLWDFGDGSTSTAQHPSHQFPSAGIFNISLTVGNNYGADTLTENAFIEVLVGGVETGTVADYDGNSYNTVKIGDQWWMADNLKTTHFADGTEIPVVESDADWINLDYTDKAYCYYDNSTAYANIYGALYTWAAAMNGAASSYVNPSGIKGICPDGWHLPSDAEWIELEMYLGMSFEQADGFNWRGTDEGRKMKNNYGWKINGNGTNSSGFSALPAGNRFHGTFDDIGETTRYWSTTEYINITHLAFNRTLDYKHSGVGWFQANHYYGYPKDFGLSVRCVKD
ncbi:MAG: secreted protein with Fibrobacter succinoprotein major domain [Bacteroidetes bacterium]|nr:MAG: secreted protein with Fibrobacter succinoprotein major domain [Bacteroidota bacterium]